LPRLAGAVDTASSAEMPKQPSIYSHDMRDELATPLCGTFRDEGPKYNTLLTKAQLGTVKPTTWDLPSQNNFQHMYGLEQVRDGSTSADVVGNWAQHHGTKNKLPGRDFKALNKLAAIEGVKTAQAISEFRQTHDARLKLGSDKPEEKKPYDESTTFGRSTGASEPFADLIAHQHRYDWASSQPAASELQGKNKPKKPASTKTSRLMAQTAQAKLAAEMEEDMWKMQCFKEVPSKIGYQG